MKFSSKYDRIAFLYNILETPIEHFMFKSWRKKVIPEIHGNILEVGLGTGKNLAYYPDDAKVTGVDVSPNMLKIAKKDHDRDMTNFATMAAEYLGFPDDTFDYVVSTFVLCVVANPEKASKEMKRVCKPDGCIINIEHMRSNSEFIAFLEDMFNPVSKALLDEHINRNIPAIIEKSGLRIIEEQDLGLVDVFRLIRSVPR